MALQGLCLELSFNVLYCRTPANLPTLSIDRRLSGTRTGVCVAENCAKRPTASRWWKRRSLKWCMSKAGEVQFAGDNGVVDTIQDDAEENTPLPEKFAQSGLREVLTPQSSLSAKAAVGASMLCLRKQGATFTWFCLRVMSREEISMPAKRCMTYVHAARQIPGSSEVVD